MTEAFENSQHRPVLAAGEMVLWHGKPKRGAFIATKSLTMFPIAVIWLILDLNIIISAISEGEMLGFLIPFFTLHLMPVWIWLGSTITAGRRWKNTHYYVTNRRIILQSGFLAVNEESLLYTGIRNAKVRIGLLDKLFHTGDIVFDNGRVEFGNEKKASYPVMEDLDNPHEVYNRIQKIIMDIQTDIEYPNAFRPAENPGYQTEYRP